MKDIFAVIVSIFIFIVAVILAVLKFRKMAEMKMRAIWERNEKANEAIDSQTIINNEITSSDDNPYEEEHNEIIDMIEEEFKD